MITGDAHENSVRDVPPDFVNFDAPPVATEFVGTSISSGGQRATPPFVAESWNPQILWEDLHHGYVRATVEPARWTTEFRTVSTVLAEQATASTEAVFAVEHGKPGAVVSPV